MSYQVLARKWRPRNFSTLVGQEHVVRALTHALNEKRLHHAYLFTGTRGVGKTTIARILAKSLNCEAGVSAEPCGHCSACQEIDTGRFVDLLEIDAASNTGAADMRELLENAVYAPTRGRYKVYVIDEVHMLSGHAFNAMLKTLEEPPEHVKFVLATTDPQKIPVTVLSRCLQFNLKQMPLPAIVEHLGRILVAEDIPFEPEALQSISRAAGGSMRDALSLLDQAIAHGAGRVDAAQVREMLGTVDTSHLLEILEALAAADGARLFAIAEDIQGRSLSAANALQELAVLLTRLQLLQLVPNLESDDIARERVKALSERFSPEFIQLAYQIVTQGRQELALAPDEHSGLMMTLLRLLAFMPLEAEGSARPVPSAIVRPAPSPDTERAQGGTTAVKVNTPANSAAAPVREDPLPALCAAPVPDTLDWHALAASLKVTGMVRALAQHCDQVSRDAHSCVLQLPPAHRHLLHKAHQDKLQQALSERLGANIQLRIDIAEVVGVTPAQAAEQTRRVRQEGAIAAIEADPFVQETLETFDASIADNSIQPLP
ncbi:MAG: DNA polymerase III subunit gamma/tau [Zoogloeaceae bacterium]|jgi:DNA polymerase-3 subunit gamma/tau|nr:DNA polymerase III subunit gamma/tau [Zoogloeaceae bacterium]